MVRDGTGVRMTGKIVCRDGSGAGTYCIDIQMSMTAFQQEAAKDL